jgi:hypothetical protein
MILANTAKGVKQKMGFRTVLLAVAILLATAHPLLGQQQSRVSANQQKIKTSPAPILEQTLITGEMLEAWVNRWQRRLGLSEWKIQTKIVRISGLPRGTIANIHWSLPKRTATIKVLDPVDSSLPQNEIVRDAELSIIHELVHLSFAKLPLDGNDTGLEEEAVKRISTALLALDQGENESPPNQRVSN